MKSTRTSCASRRGARRGFTLLELIVALTITALILGAVYEMVLMTMKGRQLIENDIQSKKIAPSLIQILKKDIEGAFRLYGEDVVFFKGDDESLDFITTSRSLLKQHSQYAECTQVGYLLDINRDDPSLRVLYRREEPYLDEQPLEGGKEIELYDRIVSMEIAYYDRESENWDTSWEVRGYSYEFEKKLQDSGDEDNGNDGEDPSEDAESESGVTSELGEGQRWPDAIRFTFEIKPSGVNIDLDKNIDIESVEFDIIISIPVAIMGTFEKETEAKEDVYEGEDENANGGSTPR